MPKAKVTVYLKQGILDPQGKAVHQILHTMGYNQVEEVRIGKFITVQFDGNLSEQQIKEQTDEMCQKLLSNPVIEDYHFEIDFGE